MSICDILGFSATYSYNNSNKIWKQNSEKIFSFFNFWSITRPERIQVVITFLMRGMTMSENSWNLSSLVAFKTSAAQLIATILYLRFSLQHSFRTAWRISFVLGWLGTGFSSSALQEAHGSRSRVRKSCSFQVQCTKWKEHLPASCHHTGNGFQQFFLQGWKMRDY